MFGGHLAHKILSNHFQQNVQFYLNFPKKSRLDLVENTVLNNGIN